MFVNVTKFRSGLSKRDQLARIVYSDASSVGRGSVIAIEGKVFQQNWSAPESRESSTLRELKAVSASLSLDAFVEELKS